MIKVIIACLFLLSSSLSYANIKVIVPFSAGGAFDIMARDFARYIENNTNETVVVENITGAGSIIGTRAMLNSRKNTILFTGSTFFVNIVRNEFEESDFNIISILGTSPYIAITNEKSTINCNNLKNNRYFVGTAGKDSGSSTSLSLMLKKYNNFDEVPFRGISAAIPEVLSGRIDFTFSLGTNHLHLSNIKPIFNTSNEEFKGIPSWRECLGIQDIFINEFVVASSKYESLEFIDKINSLAIKFVNSEDTKRKFLELGVNSTATKFEETKIISHKTLDRWRKILD
jgi:tripartite-type tricarboxylate transporter receptor subunit TctC